MHNRCRLAAVVMTFLVLIASCGTEEPILTSVPPTGAPVLPTASEVPPTAVPAAPTGTEIPPTQMPSPSPSVNLGDSQTRLADEMVMVYVPGGTFPMGSTEAQVEEALARCRDSYIYCNRWFYTTESPQHRVTVDGFWIDRTEVTNAQFRRCVEAGVCQAPATCEGGDPTYDDLSKAEHPVVCVDWHDALTYCEWTGVRLPTEAEWEYAARGQDGNAYPWGNDLGAALQNYCDANCTESWADEAVDDGYAQTSPAGSYPEGASWCGALDMAGNVYEWVGDWLGEYPSEAQANPTGPATGQDKVGRGSSWKSFQDRARTAARSPGEPGKRLSHLGFRCASSTAVAQPVTPLPEEKSMVYVPPGEFEMGSDPSDSLADEDEFPRHLVTLDGFWIDRTEVTNAQYARCVDSGSCRKSHYAQDSRYNGDDYPAVGVSWQDGADYCAWNGGRLPTEAEWEYAARGPEALLYPWGNEFDGTRLNYCDANCELSWADQAKDDGYAENAPVGSYPKGASWCGALDMAGNVWEWVADWSAEYPAMALTNPTGPEHGSHKVLRGGCWANELDGVRTAYRLSGGDATPDIRHPNVGFRCVRDGDVAEQATGLPGGAGDVTRTVLSYEDLMNGFDAASPVDESALAMPDEAAPPEHVFEGRLELFGEDAHGDLEILRGELEAENAHLPEFDYEFVQCGSYLIPKLRGQIITDHPNWNYIIGPGRVWKENGDAGYSRASFPFALVWKGGNATFNGTMTFLFNDDSVSKVWYQITQETTTYTRANFWGLLKAAYQPVLVQGADQIRAGFAQELADRFPTRPIAQLAEDYPGIDVTAFGRGISPEHMTLYGLVVNGVNYVGECRTRFGQYAYCDEMRATSYSTAKSAFVSVALMRLAQKYGPEVADLLIKDYVPEYAASPGHWERVTFNNTIDMATGNYESAGYMADEDGAQMGAYWDAQPYAKRIAAAFDWPHSADPGTRWVYRTSDTFILTLALHNYLQSREGAGADIFEFVVDEVYVPIKVGPGAHTSMRTADDNWQGQAEGGYGLWWIQDDIAKIATLLNNGGKIDDQQLLHPKLLAAAMQQEPDDRGVDIDRRRKYNNAFWAQGYGRAQGYDCEFWVPQMLGVSGNAVVLMPNGSTYYYFSDNQEFTWDAAVKESDKIAPHCP